MDEARRGQIALQYVIHLAKTQGIDFGVQLFDALAKAEVPAAEAAEFVREMLAHSVRAELAQVVGDVFPDRDKNK